MSVSINAVKKIKKSLYVAPPQNENGLYHPGNLIHDIRKSLPHGIGVDYMSDIGAVLCWTNQYLFVSENDTFTLPLNASGMGQTTAGAIGTAIANPDRITIAFVGDCGFLMNGMEVLTAVKYNIPVIWVIFNNYGYAMVSDCRKIFPKPIPDIITSAKPEGTDYAMVARGFGAIGIRIEKAGEITPEFMENILKQKRPAVLDVVVDKDAVSPGLKERIDMILEAQKAL